MLGTKLFTEATAEHTCVLGVGEHSVGRRSSIARYCGGIGKADAGISSDNSVGRRSSIARYCGGIGKADAGISSDNSGENPGRRKPKDSWVKFVCSG
jgi:hypothetical protein